MGAVIFLKRVTVLAFFPGVLGVRLLAS